MAKKKKVSKMSAKVAKIMKEGVRRNTKKPVSKSNPRRKVSQKQAVAIAFSMMGEKKPYNKKMVATHKKMMA